MTLVLLRGQSPLSCVHIYYMMIYMNQSKIYNILVNAIKSVMFNHT